MINAEHIVQNIKNALDLLSDEEQGVLRLLSKTNSELSAADKMTEGRFTDNISILSEAEALLADLCCELEHTLSGLGDTSELPEIDDRLFALRDMARKYKITIAELPAFKDEVQQRLMTVEHGADQLVALQKKVDELRCTYLKLSEDLSYKRHKAADNLTIAVMKELHDLKLEKSIFKVEVTDLDINSADAMGMNQVVFTAATNKGSDLTPIHKCASGGELARFMLALKVNLAEDNNTTLIFDEIDTGISGATASAVGERLARLAEKHQTLVITHSPQVAGYGKHHYLVQKADVEDKTVTSVCKLDKAGRLEEIARLVSGATVTDKSREVAKELLKN